MVTVGWLNFMMAFLCERLCLLASLVVSRAFCFSVIFAFRFTMCSAFGLSVCSALLLFLRSGRSFGTTQLTLHVKIGFLSSSLSNQCGVLGNIVIESIDEEVER